MVRELFISDPHFHHENMAKKRGFESAEHMNEYFVESYNKVVNKRDNVYILGDITMEKANYEILTRLKGNKFVIGGNHDKRGHIKVMLNYINGFAAMYNLKGKILTHCPIHPCELEFRYPVNIHGHVHENTIDDNRYWNVSAEVIDYTPKTIDELKEIYKWKS